jgi:signal transduction histidine kinase/CheY-like chemotaxis protein
MTISFLQSLTGEIRFQITEENLHIRAHQLRARFRLYPAMIGIQALVEPMFVWLFWERSNHWHLLIWLAGIYAVHAIDAFSWWRHREKLNTVEECNRWRLRFNIYTALTALMWGISTLWFFPQDLAYQSIIICLSLGLMAGAITLDSAYPPAMYIYVLGVSIPLLGSLVFVDSEPQWILAGMLFLYLFGTLSAGRELGKNFWTSICQRYENDQLIEQLTIQKSIAEVASRDKSRFLASASHDLRQPLQALVLFSESLQEISNDSETRHLATQIGKSVGALVDMFDELLDISKLDAGVVQAVKQDFRVQSIFDRLQTDFMPLAVAKDIEFVIQQTEFCAYSDPHLVERILRNLISNAIRYTDFGSVTVKCELENGKLLFDVMDTGIGIRANSLPHIFEEYYQVDNQHRDRLKGLGLGLAIVRRMEVLLDCHISVVSRHALGSVFSFSIPQGKEVQVSQTPQQQSMHDLTGITVALVDDNRDIRQVATKLLTKWGCRVHDGELPHEVLKPMSEAGIRPDILICDYRLPQGQTAIDGIKQLQELWDKDIPTLVLTGDTAPLTLKKIRDSGALLLHKPIAPARLRSMMYFALRSSNMPSAV